MGREVRRVPPSWVHPRDEDGHYIPLLDRDFEAELREWKEQNALWERGEHPDQEAFPQFADQPYSEWAGEIPDPALYRPKWAEEPTAYQVYENVTEGTPISPVFPTKEQLIDWLVNDGSGMGLGGTRQRMSRRAAEAFVEDGSSVSMVFTPKTGLTSGIDLYERDEP